MLPGERGESHLDTQAAMQLRKAVTQGASELDISLAKLDLRAATLISLRARQLAGLGIFPTEKVHLSGICSLLRIGEPREPYNGVVAWGDFVKPDGKLVQRLEVVFPDGHREIGATEIPIKNDFPSVAARALIAIRTVVEKTLTDPNRK